MDEFFERVAVMAEWIEVPAHRVLQIDASEFERDFESLDENGKVIEIKGVVSPKLYRRKRDEKLFRFPRYHRPSNDFDRMIFLEEV